MRIRKPIAGLALATSALTGVGAGALVLAPSLASAQEQPSTSTQSPDGQSPQGQSPDGQKPDGPNGRPHRPHGPGLAAAAKAIGVEESALREALQNGQSIADVAKANNVSVNTVVDAMVADARERITAFVNGEKPKDAPDRQQDQGQQDQPAQGS